MSRPSRPNPLEREQPALGREEPPAPDGEAGVEPGAEPAPDREPEVEPEVEPGAERAWADLERRLAAALGRMRDETFLILSTAAEADDRVCYVQFEAGDWGLRAEAVSSRFLPSERPLTAEQETALVALGWQPPGEEENARPNFSRRWSAPPPVEEVARQAVRTLREVYGVAAPRQLRHTYKSFERVLEDPDLGTEPERPAPPPRPAPQAIRSAEELRPLVEAALEGWLGLDELVRDADGDYPIRVGSALMFVQVLDGVPPLLRVFSPILRDVVESRELLDALNEINGRIRFGRVFWTSRQVIVAMELTAAGITADQVVFACTELGNLADHLDDGLHGRFGGATVFATRPTLLN